MIALLQVNAAIEADFGKFEVKTFRVDPAGMVSKVNFLEEIV